MNNTEAEYELLLKTELAKQELGWYQFEAVTLKLAPDTRYTPDFTVMAADGVIECHEVKGCRRAESAGGEIRYSPLVEDAGKVKVKVAAALFPFRFFFCFKSPALGWIREEVKA